MKPVSLRITVAGQWRILTAFPATTIQIDKQQGRYEKPMAAKIPENGSDALF